VRAIIEGKGAKVIYLPPYSPDLNPIELAWARTKWWLKTCRARSEAAINTAFHLAKTLLTSETASGCIRHCGFAVQP
jgi:transposase